MDSKKIEVYDDQEEIIDRIKELREEGLGNADMYVLATADEKIDKLQGISEIVAAAQKDAESDEPSLWDRFRNFLSGEDSYDETFEIMGIHENDRDYYLDLLEKGKVLLYIDRVFEEGYK